MTLDLNQVIEGIRSGNVTWVLTGQKGEIWSDFVFAKINEELFTEKCFCKDCFAHFTMKNSRGNCKIK